VVKIALVNYHWVLVRNIHRLSRYFCRFEQRFPNIGDVLVSLMSGRSNKKAHLTGWATVCG
jgi:hypothetical protein